MATRDSKKSRSRIQENYLRIRNELWPNLDQKRIWDRKQNKGFTTVPRTMPLICKILNGLTSGQPVSGPYLDLWCRSWDEAFVIIENEQERAFYSGFTGQRALYTWRDRMRSLRKLGFIDTKPGSTGKYNYVLIWNPHVVIDEARTNGSLPIPQADFNALTKRIIEIGG